MSGDPSAPTTDPFDSSINWDELLPPIRPANRIDLRVSEDCSHVTVVGDGGRELLVLNSDGTVDGPIEDASEAGRLFVGAVRQAWSAAAEPGGE